jgi:diguanylate cyclase (GGDEF)-like protein
MQPTNGIFLRHERRVDGDPCIKSVAEILSRCVARPIDLVARYGGEEFAVLLPEEALEGAKMVARRILDAVRAAAIPHANSPIAVTLPTVSWRPEPVAFDNTDYQNRTRTTANGEFARDVRL